MRKYIPILLAFQSCIGAGDMFASREKITGNYYLMEDEGGGYVIGYKMSSGYIGRSPSNSRVVAYAIKDSILAMKVRYYDSSIQYYALNKNKDNETAKEEDIFIDTVDNKEFSQSWMAKLEWKLASAQ